MNKKEELKETKTVLLQNERTLKNKTYSVQQELVNTIEELKDIKEHNTALQLQLDNLTKTHKELKNNYEELIISKRNLEARLAEIDASFTRCKSELLSMKECNEKLSESEHSLRKQLEIERLQSKTAKLQTEKDAVCILDLNRQVKEMERIIQRKYPDSMSGLLTSTRNNPDANKTPRHILENRIKELEAERMSETTEYTATYREMKEKLAKMEVKYESHIQDLETHVIRLTNQIKSKRDTYDIYTQTYTETMPKLTDNHIKEVYNRSTQTDLVKIPKSTVKKSERNIDTKDDSYLLATIRGLHAEIANKEKTIGKLQKEIEELRKSNRKLYKDKEGNIKKDNKSNDKQFIKTPDTPNSDNLEREVKILKDARDQLKVQLCKLEDDYQNLKTRRLQDLNTLQSAHERELMTYMSNIGPMREQLDVQQISINTLQSQLASCKEELAIITVERDHIDARLKNFTMANTEQTSDDNTTQLSLQKKIAYLERRYEEREHRLRAIVHGLAQKQVTAKDCAQCAARQQQLIGYKAELDQLLATLRYLQ